TSEFPIIAVAFLYLPRDAYTFFYPRVPTSSPSRSRLGLSMGLGRATCHRPPRSPPGLVPFKRPTERALPDARVALRNPERPA
ncbi:hypothetical protein OH77DRAFT_1392880, partial [Trametes cingulata]